MKKFYWTKIKKNKKFWIKKIIYSKIICEQVLVWIPNVLYNGKKNICI